MASSVSGVLASLRRPEYTGENRCLPCTLANLGIAVAASVVVGVLWLPVGVALLVASLAAIYLRGYLVPGTPELTKRYLPDGVHSLFDAAGDHPSAGGEEIDVEPLLLTAGVVVECRDEDDLCLERSFRERQRRAMDAARRSDDGLAALADLLDVDPSSLVIDEHDDAFVVRYSTPEGPVRAGQWESRAAFLADLGGAAVVPKYVPAWDRLGPAERGRVLRTIRLFIEECPACGGPVELRPDTVESCCRSWRVAAATCAECGERLFEVEIPDER